MIIGINKATKMMNSLTEENKIYQFKLKLGENTLSFDKDTEIINTNENWKNVDLNLINETIPKFLGNILQTVPIYSAIKVNGKRLYEIARKNENIQNEQDKIEIDLPKKEKFVHYLKLLNYDNKQILEFETKVSKGTYIRSLGTDLANSLNNSGGHLIALKRLAIGDYYLDNSLTFDELIKDKF
jgi:tRNA pseudouridine55 synthase